MYAYISRLNSPPRKRDDVPPTYEASSNELSHKQQQEVTFPISSIDLEPDTISETEIKKEDVTQNEQGEKPDATGRQCEVRISVDN